jgi:DNA-binding FadR family transcriptional regulator
MEWVGLVGRVEQDLERTIAQGQLPEDGFLPSENCLAKYYGVSRTTVREALRRLAARNLVVQHPGRRSRAVALDEAVTLESLSVVFNGEGPLPPERLRLLEGYLALMRDTAVELLVACCEQASARDLSKLEELCFSLMDSARWEPAPGRWVALEFDLLRLAARAANRPGPALLLQSLERSYRAMARHLFPHVDATSIRQWALCAFQALGEKDIPRLKQELAVLLKAGDEHLLKKLSPAHEPATTPLPSRPADEPFPLRDMAPEALEDELTEAQESDLSASPPVLSPVSTASDEAPPDHTALDQLAPGDASAAGSPVTGAHTAHGRPDQGGGTGPVSPNLSTCRTGSRESQPTGAPLEES